MLTDIKKIVVPTDFSGLADEAMQYALQLAETFNASITLLHAIELYQHNTVGYDKYEEVLEEVAQGGLEQYAESLQQNVPVHLVLEKGKAYQTITEVAQRESADLIVMGTHGASGVKEFKRYWLGTNAYKVVNSAPCPVLTIPENSQQRPIENIALPLDITQETKSQVSLALLLAKVYGATIHVFTVSTFLEEFVVDMSKIRNLLKETTSLIDRADVDYTSHIIRHDQIARSILHYSDEVEADLIIMATRHKNKWNDRLLGSTAKRVVTQSKRPVLSISPPEEEERPGKKDSATESHPSPKEEDRFPETPLLRPQSKGGYMDKV